MLCSLGRSNDVSLLIKALSLFIPLHLWKSVCILILLTESPPPLLVSTSASNISSLMKLFLPPLNEFRRSFLWVFIVSTLFLVGIVVLTLSVNVCSGFCRALFGYPFRTETLTLPARARFACDNLQPCPSPRIALSWMKLLQPLPQGTPTFKNSLMQAYRGLAHLLRLEITLKGHRSFRTPWGIDQVWCCNSTIVQFHLLPNAP